jgi:Xaa-Pro aminopeptidase
MKKLLPHFFSMLALASLALAQEGVPLFTKDFTPEEFAQRRNKVYDAIGVNALAVVQGAPSPAGYVRFRQSNEFYYLCGIEVPHAYLLLDGAARRAVLYLPHYNEARERGEGKVLAAEDTKLVTELSGVDAVYGVEALGEHLARFARSADKQTLFVPFSPAEGFATSRDLALRAIGDLAADPWDGRPSREGHFIDLLHTRFPHFEVKNLTPILDQLRLIKSPAELTLIHKATRLSGLALLEGMRSTQPGLFEYELDAMAKFVFYRNGAQGEAYYSLIASAGNAWYPHYNAGKRKMQDGDFLLMDFAPDVGYYMSDVTRMWPVNGKFNAWQTELYDFYLGCYEAILAAIRPQETPAAIKQEAVKVMEALLAKSKFSKPHHQKAAREFVESYRAGNSNRYTSLGHWVGMATHDVGSHSGQLQPGMVFTIEPALRVPEEKIYIRLEDVVVITADGKEVLSDFVPRDRSRIEKIMAERGMLEEYAAEQWTSK